MTVLLGTVALEPNRWGTVDRSGQATIDLADVRPDLEAKVGLLQDLGFRGSWTIEFVHGLLSDHDHPEPLLAQAAADLAVLREVLA